jgi:hypothetical protein
MSKVEFPKGEGPKITINELCAPSTYKVPVLNEKPDLTLLDTGALKGAAYVMMDGANKPGRSIDAWKDLSFEDAMKRIASAYRHLMDIKDGEFFDKESGLQNADHLLCNAMIIRYHIDKHLRGLANGSDI